MSYLKTDKLQLDIIINGDESRKELMKLEGDGKKLRAELKKMTEGTEDYIKKSNELKLVEARMEAIRKEIGLTGSTMKELRQRQRELNAALSNIDPRLPVYRELRTELNQVNARMGELRGNAQTTGLSLGKMADGFNRYMGMFAAATASLTGVVLGIKAAKKASDEYEQSLQNLSALTGLEGMDLSWLGEQAKKMGTETQEGGIKITKGATDILRAYTLMGSAKPELLKDKEALNEVTKQALILAEAAQMETEPAVTALASIMNQFGAGADQAGKYINVLAAGAKEGAAEIPDLGDSIIKFGAAAGAANIPVEQSVALVEALSEKGIKGEIAGTGLKTMLIKLMSGADDTNPKIVGLNTALDNLAAKNMSAAEMTKLFGLESYTVAQNIINQKDRVGELTTAVTGTNTAYEQAAKTTSSAKAAMEQAKNRLNLMAIELGEKLTPALTLATGWTTKFIQAFITIINFAKENKGVLITLTTTVIAYAAATKISAIWTNRHNAESLISITITKAKKIADEALFATTQLLAAAQMLLTGNLKGATQAMKVFMATTASNPIGLLVGAISLAIGAFLLLKDGFTSTSKAAAEFYTELSRERTNMNNLFDVVKKTTEGTKERKDGIEQINKVYGQYLPQLLTEKSSLNDIKNAQLAANTALKDSIALKSKEKQMTEIVDESTKSQLESMQDLMNYVEKKKGASTAGLFQAALTDELEKYNTKTEKDRVSAVASLSKNFGVSYLVIKDYADKIAEAKNEEIKKTKDVEVFYDSYLKKRKTEFNEETRISQLKAMLRTRLSKEERADITKQLNELTKIKKDASEKEGNDPNLNGGSEVHKLKENNKEKIDIEKESYQLTLSIMKDGWEKKLLQEEFLHKENLQKYKGNNKLIELEQLRHSKEMGEIIVDRNNENSINRLTPKESSKKDIVSFSQDPKIKQLILQADYEQRLYEQTLDFKKQSLKESLAANEISEKEYNDKISELNRNAIAEKIDLYGNQFGSILGSLSQIQSNLNQNELNEFKRAQDDKKRKLEQRLQSGLMSQEQYDKQVQSLDEETNKKQKELAIEQANRDKALRIFDTVINTAAAIVKALPNIPLAIISGVMGAAQLGVIMSTPVPEMATGNVDVIGAQSGRRYNARRGGRASGVSLVKSPTMMQSENGANFLMGEQMPELIIDGPRTRNMMLNYPEIFNAIRSIPQFAAGNVSTKEIRTESKMFTDERLINALDILVNKLNGVDLLTLSNKLGKVDTNKKNINDKFNTTVE